MKPGLEVVVENHCALASGAVTHMVVGSPAQIGPPRELICGGSNVMSDGEPVSVICKVA